MSNAKLKNRIQRAIKTVVHLGIQRRPVLHWYASGAVSENWGDKLNPVLFQMLSGVKPVNRTEVIGIPGLKAYGMIGSNLGGFKNRHDHVWGSGFISHSAQLQIAPSQVHAVRGHLSLEKIRTIATGFTVPVGDPAILYCMLRTPRRLYGPKLGVVAHFRERDMPVYQELSQAPGIRIIDICGELEQVVDEISACSAIASSSLHGLIIADAMRVPSIWVEHGKLLLGDGFKFNDYYSSIGHQSLNPLYCASVDDFKNAIDSATLKTLDIDLVSLIKSCPFISGSRSNELCQRISGR